MKHKYVTKEITRHGRAVYYFRRARETKRVRLPDINSPDFQEAYDKAAQHVDFTIKSYKQAKAAEEKRALVRALEKSVIHTVARAKHRSAQKGRDFSLTNEWAIQTIKNQDYKCCLSGVAFDPKHSASGHMNPFSPSIDRVDNSKGYTEDNSRIVISSLNIMLSDWGTGVFETVATAYAQKQKENDVTPHFMPDHPSL